MREAQVLFTSWNLTVAITSGPSGGSTSKVSHAAFAFRSRAGARFECSLDSKSHSSCSSPASYTSLANGPHTFRVYATIAGLSGHVAAVTWTVASAGGGSGTPGGTLPSAGGSPPATGTSTLPPAPTGLVATGGNAQVSLSWNAVSDGAGISGYRVLRGGVQIAQVTATSYTNTGLQNGVTYSYTVEAVDKGGRVSPQSASVSATTVAPGGPPSPPQGGGGSPPAPLTAWVSANGGIYTPLSDQAAAADVVPAAENRPANAAANDYMPTSSQLQAFYGATNQFGQTVAAANPYYAYVTGHFTGTTDEIIQWAAWKWGIPADWLRAQYSVESYWRQSEMGDVASVSPAVYAEYPPQARIPGGDQVNETMGISAVKWIPDGSVGAGTEPLRWESTAFACDYQAATIRYYYDNPDGLRSGWGDSSYFAGNAWDALGGWFEPYPWLNSGQLEYIAKVQGALADRTWAQPGF
jgi:hypothetical protein